MKSIVYNGKEYKSIKDLADVLGISSYTLYSRLRRSKSEEGLNKVKYDLFGEGFNSVKSALTAYGLGDICVTKELPTSTSFLRFIGYNGQLPYLVEYEGIVYKSILYLSNSTSIPVSTIFRCMVVDQLTLAETFDVFYCETKSSLAKGPFKVGNDSFKNVLDVAEHFKEPYVKIYKSLRIEDCATIIKKLKRSRKKKSKIGNDHLIYHDFSIYGRKYESIKHLAKELRVTPNKIYRLLYNHKFSFEEIYDYITLGYSKGVDQFEKRSYII